MSGYLWFVRTLFPRLVVDGDRHILADRTGSRGTRGKSRTLMGFQRIGAPPGLNAGFSRKENAVPIGNNVLKGHSYRNVAAPSSARGANLPRSTTISPLRTARQYPTCLESTPLSLLSHPNLGDASELVPRYFGIRCVQLRRLSQVLL